MKIWAQLEVWLLRKVFVGGGGWVVHSRIESLQVLLTFDFWLLTWDLDCDNLKIYFTRITFSCFHFLFLSIVLECLQRKWSNVLWRVFVYFPHLYFTYHWYHYFRRQRDFLQKWRTLTIDMNHFSDFLIENFIFALNSVIFFLIWFILTITSSFSR